MIIHGENFGKYSIQVSVHGIGEINGRSEIFELTSRDGGTLDTTLPKNKDESAGFLQVSNSIFSSYQIL